MAQRDYPYSNFTYIVNLGGETGSGDQPIGGFSEVQGISTEMNYADYRAGNAKTNTMSKYPNTHKLGTLTLKRGDDVFQADNMDYDNLERIMELRGRMHGVLQPRKTAP